MQPEVFSSSRTYERGPKFLKALRPILETVDRVFDWAYGSKYNPLYRSGVLVLALMSIVTVTGLYLIFLYKITAPYESMQMIQDQVWLGRWMRSLHRYCSDAAVIAVGFHVLRIMIEGKTWGPRFLAWTSGVILLGLMFLSGWTGYVMVWDRHGQIIGEAGAHLIDLLPVLPEPFSRAFSGASVIGSSFFFMNLFLHVAVPLGMVFGMWLHTSRLARTVWFPRWGLFFRVFAAVFILSILWPAPLPRSADVLEVKGKFLADIFYSFWVPADWHLHPVVTASLWAGFFLFLFSIPAWWRPSKSKEPKASVHDEAACTGCRQCTLDCPFDAIEMVPRTIGEGSAEVAHVFDDLCVSCGICAGSCSQFAIGPTSRNGRDQLAAAKAMKAEWGAAGGIGFLYCINNPTHRVLLENAKKELPNIAPIPIECVGTVHPGVVTYMLMHFKGLAFVGCPPDLCLFREGSQVVDGRLFHERSPGPPARVDLRRIKVLAGTSAETKEILEQLKAFDASLATDGTVKGEAMPQSKISVGAFVRGVLFTVPILAILGFGTRVELGEETDQSYLRLSWRIPGQSVEMCHDLTEAEKAKLPMHMRKPRECVTHKVSYKLKVEVDGKTIEEREFAPGGARADRPVVVLDQFPFEPGHHNISIAYSPIRNPAIEGELKAVDLRYELATDFVKGRAVLITYDPTTQQLIHRQ